ncbi:MAG TPA: lactate racemase domain-containing protein, partial [Thermoplasmata archaeon]
MHLEIPYGGGKEIVEVPEENLMDIVYQKDVRAYDKAKVVLDAINKPVASQPLSEFLKGGENVLVIVNDATRPTPS